MLPAKGIGAAAVLFLLGMMTPGHALDQKGGQQKGKQGENRGKGSQRPQDPGAQQQRDRLRQPVYTQEHTPEQAKAWQQKRGWQQHGAWRPQDSWQKHRARNWASDHRSWPQRGGYGGYYVPPDRFNLYFGSGHPFLIRSRPLIYMGHPRFAYREYSFVIVDPWPEYWPENWYESDYVYVDYDDGYYLYNRNHPQVRLAIALTL